MKSEYYNNVVYFKTNNTKKKQNYKLKTFTQTPNVNKK